MREKTKDFIGWIHTVLIVWALLSLFASAVKVTDNAYGENNCGKSYPIDRVIYTNLFCEIKND